MENSSKPERYSGVLEKFGYALRNMQDLDSRPSGMDGEIFDLLFDSAELSIFTPTERIKYENEMTSERDIRNWIAYARKEGKEVGREEEKVEIAQKMMELGVDDATIIKITGVKPEQFNERNQPGA